MLNAGFARRSMLAGAASSFFPTLTFGESDDIIDSHEASSAGLKRIAFGSCAHQGKAQPIWDRIREWNPDIFIFLGDSIYGDGLDPSGLREAYRELGAKPEFRRFRNNIPIVAMWDDHDYGANDSGEGYRWARASKDVFLDFFGEASKSPRRQRDGLHAAYLFGPPGARIHLIVPDLRTHRSRLRVRDFGKHDYRTWAATFEKAGHPVPGPYEKRTDRGASMLSEEQWLWLERQLAVPAEFTLIASSLQVLADFPGWEAWANFPSDRERLFDAIRRHRTDGVIFISGDTHYGEISRVDSGAPYPLWDITSSGLTEVWPTLAPNTNRIGPALRGHNFGTLSIEWRPGGTEIVSRVHDGNGEARLSQRIRLSDLVIREA